MKIKHTGIMVSDMDGALDFYRDELGLDCTFMVERKQEKWLNRLLNVDGGHTVRIAYVGPLELIEYYGAEGELFEMESVWGEAPYTAHVCFEVEDITPWMKKLANRMIGYALIPDGPNEGAEVGYFRGFDDFVIELFQPKAKQ